MFLRKRRSFEYRHCRCLKRIAIALNRCSVYGQIQYTKPPEHLCLLNKLFTVFFSSGFNVKLLHDWSNFDLPKLMPVDRRTHFLDAFVMFVSHTNTRQDTCQ